MSKKFEGIPGLSFKPGEFNVLALITDEGGCGWYRVRQYLNEFERQGLANIHILRGEDSDEVMAGAKELSSVVLARNGNAGLMRHILEIEPNKPFIVDHDDNTMVLDEFNEAYVHFGVQDRWAGDKPVYVSGLTPGFNRYKNLWGQQEFQFMLRAADLTTSPVENLSELWSKFSGYSAVIPNGIDFNLYPDVSIRDNTKPKDEVRIGWHGGQSHLADIGTIAKSITNTLQKNKNAMFYSTGAYFRKLFAGYESRIVVNSWIAFQAHPYRLATLDLDIGVVPLSNHPFNDFKSEIKFTELAALRIPALVVDRLPYSRVCQDGVNCLTYKTTEEFQEKLQLLIDDKKLRNKLAKNAYEWVREERDMKNLAVDAFELYKGLV